MSVKTLVSDNSQNPISQALMALASLLEYPVSECKDKIKHASELFSKRNSISSENLGQFKQLFSRLDQDQREELFTATFDITPSCAPYVSIHLFGEENFKRGEFMAALSARYAETCFEAAGELPDHIAVLLRFAAQTNEAERRELVEFCLLGPINKMKAAVSAKNPYYYLLAATLDLLSSAYPGLKAAPSPLEQVRQDSRGCGIESPGCSCVPRNNIEMPAASNGSQLNHQECHG